MSFVKVCFEGVNKSLREKAEEECDTYDILNIWMSMKPTSHGRTKRRIIEQTSSRSM